MKNLLLHIHEDDEQSGRLGLALHLAEQTHAHLTCVQATPMEVFAADPLGGMFGMAGVIDTIHSADKAQRAAAEARLGRAGVTWHWHSSDGNVVETLIDQALLADLVILSQRSTTADRSTRQPLAIVGDVVMHTGCPVLLVPAGSDRLSLAAPALVAWNGSAEAAHALRLALPLLQRASAVHIVEVSGDSLGVPARDAAVWLSRHDIGSDVHDWPAKGRRTSAALRDAASELSAAYIVMGAYGRSRLRETVLGGVTRELIASSSVPLLLAH
ncbi:universal stress protein [Sandarakinorhabdus sp.]|uniref:universal stress protein n=1 Tax=Sandarakinorhabdus sp. TaxID=1916663 RepID=UPI003340CC6C